MTSKIQFKKYYVTNGAIKARVHYSAHLHTGANKLCVTLYAKSCEDGNKLKEIMGCSYENETDIMTDYFETGRARVFIGSPLYSEALARANGN